MPKHTFLISSVGMFRNIRKTLSRPIPKTLRLLSINWGTDLRWFLVGVFEENARLLQFLVFFRQSVQRDRFTFCALCIVTINT